MSPVLFGFPVEYLIIGVLLLALLVLYLLYSRLSATVEKRAYQVAERWRRDEIARIEQKKEAEMESRVNEKAGILFQSWRQSEEKKIRQDAVAKSQAVTKGKITEHLIPYFPAFAYNPKDARFLGSPVDFFIFDGLSEGDLSEIVLVEVKTGKSQLSKREKQVKECVEGGRVRYEVMRHG